MEKDGSAQKVLINHIAAVVLPVLGGLARVIDYRIPFFVGAGMACISLVAVQAIRVSSQVGIKLA
ncbi:hypothetical protein [Desulfoferrobacter suflitae]|uniref:hypothetical protein n=1 Tax=Desulfoferrobacter suflitae TaxID=2865782 RepID=UPI0021641CE1|nr:hypothetical protein [Desulfoferrobacter suflitae]MCK8603520.1 hypothetical protein [Desulfoferrobacter suflitae]